MYSAIILSLLVMAAASAIAILIGVALAFSISRCQLVGRNAIRWLVGGWLFVPLYVQACAWSAGFGNLGWWTLSQVQGSQEWLRGVWAVVWIHSAGCVPAVTFLVSLGLRSTSRNREDLAYCEGGLRNVIMRAWLPSTRNWIVAAGLWCLASIGNDMLVTNLFQVRTAVEQLYLDLTIGEWEVSKGLLGCLPALVVAAFAATLAWPTRYDKSLDRWSESSTLALPTSSKWMLSMIAWALVASVILLPFFNLLVKAGWDVQRINNQTVRTWNLSRFAFAVAQSPTLFTEELWWSVQLALYASLTAAAIAILSISSKTVHRWPWTTTVFAAVFALALPGPMVNYLLARLFMDIPMTGLDWIYDRTLIPVILALQFRLLPVGLLWVDACWRKWYRTHRDLLFLDGESSFLRLRLRFVLANRQELILGTLLLFAMAFAEFSVYSQLLPPNVTPISKRIFELLHYGVRYQEAGISLFLAVVGMVVGALASSRVGSR